MLVVVIVVEAVGITVGVVDSGAIVTVDVDFVVAVVDVVSKGVVGLAIVCVLVAVVRVDFGFVVIAPAAVGVRIVVVVVGASVTSVYKTQFFWLILPHPLIYFPTWGQEVYLF